MRPWLRLTLLVGFLLCTAFCTSSPTSPVFPAKVEVYFSPDGGAQDAIVERIDSAESTIDVAMYALTNREIAWALVRAHERGVKVRVLLDGDFDASCKYSKGTFLSRHGVKVKLDRSHIVGGEVQGHMHNKFAVIDGKVVITGSYNWTASAEHRNDENLLIITEAPKLCRKYESQFVKLWTRGEPVEAVPEVVLSAQDAEALKEHAGKEVVVRGKVYDVYHSERTDTYFLHFGPERPCFTAVIFRSAAKEFLSREIDPMDYEGKVVQVTGELVDHPKYGLEMVLESPSQVEVKE
ncbi:MAG: hypothetical protein DRP94_04000 [Candidatus Latescibacterota bacterium]|nr:MAG: hypothetical protein DRP94_04000 [Candidatus Latescibacterota bacterium]